MAIGPLNYKPEEKHPDVFTPEKEEVGGLYSSAPALQKLRVSCESDERIQDVRVAYGQRTLFGGHQLYLFLHSDERVRVFVASADHSKKVRAKMLPDDEIDPRLRAGYFRISGHDAWTNSGQIYLDVIIETLDDKGVKTGKRDTCRATTDL